ncbi:thrombospondin type 1 domain protein [Ancylostoma ceylanicum]|uniref:Thrombospondin type 1 domain protein n=1 Tax=Ancylostoma ceylanicum TaxID=53326 RepID=A0A0D6MBL3_9BILA|nr:thrombospondin type 1 domain protein [Ancylostoma ceylanicum]
MDSVSQPMLRLLWFMREYYEDEDIGPTTVTAPCNIDVCYFPRLSCCPGFESTLIDGRHACGPQVFGANGALPFHAMTHVVPVVHKFDLESVFLYSTDVLAGFSKKADTVTKTFYCGPLPVEPPFNPQQTTCCDPEKEGLWNQWTEWTKCTSTCGLCGTQTRNRTCASQPYGCACKGDTTQTQACGQQACTTGQPCCTGYPAVGYDGANFCQPNPPAQCPGTWTAWMTEQGAKCNDTCGMCGVIPSYRYCWPSGCQCTGAFKMNQACGAPVCTFPRATCCAPYVKKIVNKQFVCA